MSAPNDAPVVEREKREEARAEAARRREQRTRRAAERRANATTATRRWVLDLAAAALLVAVPIAGFWPTFGGPAYLPAAVGGALVGLAVAAFAARLRWGVLEQAGLVMLAYFLLGPALAVPQTTILGVIPTLESWIQLGAGIVTSWKQLLTTFAPVPASEQFLIVPFLLSLVAATLTAGFGLRLRHAAWALLPAAAYLATQIALGTSQPAIPVVEGIVFAVVAVVWLALREAWAPSSAAVSLGSADGGADAARSGSARRALLGSGVIAIAVVAGVATSGFAAPASPRYVLRDVVIPPFDVREYPSPLQSFRSIVRDYPADTLFTVTGLPEGARVRLAAMDAYSGTVYNVSDEGPGSSSAFVPMRDTMSPTVEGTEASVRVEIGELEGVWMPEVGSLTSVRFDGDRADDLRRSAHYNAETQTAVVTAALQEGDAYDLDVVVPSVPSDKALEGVGFAPVRLPKQQGVPKEFAEIASDAAADASTPIEQVRALQEMLSTEGFFSHGLEGQPLSRAGHGAERITSLLGSEQMVGDDEQYAVAMALLARELGIPARVVLGFYPDDDRADEPVFEANGENVHAWVEVAFDGVGWVPFDPTPPEDQVPSDQETKPRADPKPQVLQPPPPQQEPVDLPPTIPDEREPEEGDDGIGAIIWAIVSITAATLGILALLASPIIVIGALKAARRRKRRNAERAADRISGGWDELVDRAVDYGTPVRVGATRQEDAVLVRTTLEEPAVTTLADRADAQVFGPTEPTQQDVDEFWRQVEEIVGTMGSRTTFWRRVRARLSLRSLLAGTRFALARPFAAARASASTSSRRSRTAADSRTPSEPAETA